MRSRRGLTLPLAVLAVLAVGMAMTGAVRYTLGIRAEASTTEVVGCGESGAPACGDRAREVHLERDATIRSTGTSDGSRAISGGT